MKKYTSLGALMIDFRSFKNMTQAELASKFDVDIRTVIRWEKNETLLKSDKEEEMVDITFIPYQVIRNLNAPVSIPTYYDFNVRKYSLSNISKELPDPNWIIDLHAETNRMRTIKYDSDIDEIIRYSKTQHHVITPISKEVILRASELLPEINQIIFDTSGFYSGHTVFLPISKRLYNKIRKRVLTENDITVSDLIDYKKQKTPVFYSYNMCSDCNENFFYLAACFINFLKKINKEYIYASYTSRNDSYHINTLMGVYVVWEDKKLQEEIKSLAPPRLYESNNVIFRKFLDKHLI
ncbi:helix-turn-helix domain-containing protein [Xanthomarina sp. F2636L]|uniref:helix-turn-helix domain-containing protein n=1 Tax=Xanthomarina sp. F2636L TaxID=2996018 RepID=UPI00225E00E6|nr:helix-turn-helix transcriptional regulator [Xanthomarina sp. F2636L]MCX7551889.1 helix-turn-helix transcriptional regulator [Xanthomarina sp. F2636L]